MVSTETWMRPKMVLSSRSQTKTNAHCATLFINNSSKCKPIQSDSELSVAGWEAESRGQHEKTFRACGYVVIIHYAHVGICAQVRISQTGFFKHAVDSVSIVPRSLEDWEGRKYRQEQR